MANSDQLPPGAIAAEQISVRHGLSGIIYGYPGIGKTSLVAGVRMAQTGGDVLYLDCEGGSLSVAGLPGVYVKRIKEWKEVSETYRWLLNNARTTPIKTVVIDTLTALQRIGLTHLMATSKTPEMPNMGDFGRSNEQIGRMVRDLVDLCDSQVDATTGQVYLGWNVLFICHLAEQKDERTGEVTIRPALTPKAAEITAGIVDMLGLMTIEPGTNNRLLVMENWNSALGKIRQPPNRPAMPTKMRVPRTTGDDGLADDSVTPALARVLQHLQGEINLNERDRYPELFPPRKPKNVEGDNANA